MKGSEAWPLGWGGLGKGWAEKYGNLIQQQKPEMCIGS